MVEECEGRDHMLTYNADRATIEVSVGELCRMALKYGDLDHSLFRAGAWHRQEGTSLHAMLQEAAGPEYTAEVPLSNTMLFEGLNYTVSGRADGVIRKRGESRICVEEIKSVRGGLFYNNPPEVYLAQLRCYAHFLCAAEGHADIDVCLTYIHADSHKLRRFEQTVSAEALAEYYLGLLRRVRQSF